MIRDYIRSFFERKIVNFSISFLTSLGLFLLLQPEQDQAPKIGFATIIYNDRTCLHIHHWVYMVSYSLIITCVTILSEGRFTHPIVAALGGLSGGSFSDLYYTDAFEFENCNGKYKSVI